MLNEKTGKYTSNMIDESVEGWLLYDAAWKCFKTIFKWRSGRYALDIGAGSGVMAGMFKLFDKNYNVTKYEGSPYNIDYIYFDTVYSSHVLEHLEKPEKCIDESIRIASKRIIHVVPDGCVDDKNLGTKHIQTFNRISFKKLFKDRKDVKIVDYGVIEDTRMSSLYIVLDKVK